MASLPGPPHHLRCRRIGVPCLSRLHRVTERDMPPPGPVSEPSFRAPPRGYALSVAPHRYHPIHLARLCGFQGTYARGTRPLDRVREATRIRHYSRRTAQAYCAWIRRFILFNGRDYPAGIGAARDVSTRMIYTQVLNTGWRRVRSPADAPANLQGAIGLCDSPVRHNAARPRHADQRSSLTAQCIATSVRAPRPVLDCSAIGLFGLYGMTQV